MAAAHSPPRLLSIDAALGVGGFRELVGGGPTYVSIDIDALDMPFVPGCSSAEIGGFTYDEMRQMLFGLARGSDVVGFDLVLRRGQQFDGQGFVRPRGRLS